MIDRLITALITIQWLTLGALQSRTHIQIHSGKRRQEVIFTFQNRKPQSRTVEMAVH